VELASLDVAVERGLRHVEACHCILGRHELAVGAIGLHGADGGTAVAALFGCHSVPFVGAALGRAAWWLAVDVAADGCNLRVTVECIELLSAIVGSCRVPCADEAWAEVVERDCDLDGRFRSCVDALSYG